MTASVWLTLNGIPANSWAHAVTPRRQTAGRSTQSDIYVMHPSVSRQHAEFWQDGDEFFVKDLGSRNGTLVNGVPIVKLAIRIGYEIQLGEAKLKVVSNADIKRLTPTEDSEPTLLVAPRDEPAREILSPAEFRVFSLLLKGYSEAKAAEKLHLTKNTVHTHVKRIYQKLDVHSSKELMAKFLNTEADG